MGIWGGFLLPISNLAFKNLNGGEKMFLIHELKQAIGYFRRMELGWCTLN
jgi:hypothetical protein